MILSTPQVSRFWREWSKTCKAMNWTKAAGMTAGQIDAERKRILAECGFESLTAVDRVTGFTKVLKALQVLQEDDLDAGIEADDTTINDGRVLRNVILTEIVPCLELYVDNVQAVMTDIMQDKNRWWKIDRPIREMNLMDLPTQPVIRLDRKSGQPVEFASPLKQMLMTLSRVLNDKRRAAGDSIHAMKIKAGLPCHCAGICRKRANQTAFVAALAGVPVPEEAEIEQPF